MARRTIVLGDLHLVADSPADVVEDLGAVLREHRGARVIFAGDLFDLSADHPREPKRSALAGAFERRPDARALLAEHVERDGELWLLGGNHDAAVGELDHRADLVRALGLRAGAERVRSSPWFLRAGGLHVEHGHVFDPDNATSHPLVSDVRSLGVHFVEEFIAPTGAFRYLNANDGTPLKLFLSAFSWYGRRGPFVVFKYFDTAFRAVSKSGPFWGGAAEELTGVAREPDFAQAAGVAPDLIQELLKVRAQPTMTSLSSTLSRLYLDRVAATCAILAGLGLVAAGQRRRGAFVAGAGALAMGVSWALHYDRYGGSVPELLEQGAREVARVTGANLVVLGHAHREAESERYANTGSFAFPRGAPGRPYLEIEGPPEAPRARRRYHLRGAA